MGKRRKLLTKVIALAMTLSITTLAAETIVSAKAINTDTTKQKIMRMSSDGPDRPIQP